MRVPRRRLGTGFLAGATFVAAGCASISPEQEAQLGADYAAQIEQELPLVDDAQINRYINQLGRQIAAQGGRPFDYRFHVVNAEPINAFAVPGGYVYVNRGLVDATDNMMELAGVLAHEIGHVEERHSAEQFERVQSANVGLNLAYVLLGREPGTAEELAIGVGGNLVLADYSRAAEDEADAVAIPLLVRAGIHPRGLLTFFDQLLEEQGRSPGGPAAWFSTHPTTQDRIESTRQRLAEIPDRELAGLTQNSDAYEAFKRRLAGYPAPPPEYRN